MPSTRTRHVLLAAAGAGLVLGAGPAAAADLPEPKSTTSGDTTTIVVRTADNEQTYTPKGGKPGPFPEDENFVPGVGDVTTDTAQYLQGGTKVGHDSGVCTVSKVVETTVSIDCVVTVTFASGTLKAVFDQTFDLAEEEEDSEEDGVSVPIVGGTGDYKGAKGTATVRGVDDGNDDDEEFSDEITFTFTTGGGQVSQTPVGGAAAGGGTDVSGADAGLIGIGLATVAGGGLLLAARGRVARRVH